VAAPAAKSNQPQVLVANYPLQYFAQRIAGDAVEVRFLAPKDEDPAFWHPDETAIAAFQGADLILMNGATYSKWADKITLPESKAVDTSASFKASLIQVNETSTHSHGPGGEHSHSGTAFTDNGSTFVGNTARSGRSGGLAYGGALLLLQTTHLNATTVRFNQALAGQGYGGGVALPAGPDVLTQAQTMIRFNRATTAGDDLWWPAGGASV
jgi:hypothetical protein